MERCRNAGITIPIIPGVKPITNLTQLSLLPKVFHVDLPTELATELIKCQDDAAAKQVGVEWCLNQSRELLAHGVENIHYYCCVRIYVFLWSGKDFCKEYFKANK